MFKSMFPYNIHKYFGFTQTHFVYLQFLKYNFINTKYNGYLSIINWPFCLRASCHLSVSYMISVAFFDSVIAIEFLNIFYCILILGQFYPNNTKN